MNVSLLQVTRLNDDLLLQQMKHLRSDELRALRNFLVYLAEVEVRQLYLSLGYSSLYSFLVEALGFCESAAIKRVAACRVVRTFPEMLQVIESGKIHLTGIRLLAKHLNDRNVRQTIEACSGKSKAWIEEYVAKTFSFRAAPVRESVRIYAESGTRDEVPQITFPEMCTVESVDTNAIVARDSAQQKKLVRLHITVDEETYELMKNVRDMSGSKDMSAAVKVMAKQYVAKKTTVTPGAKKKAAAIRVKSKPSRYVPKAVRVAVRKRDQNQCTFTADDGHRCTQKRHLHFDHEKPFALGGRNTVDNLRLLCSAHNLHAARETFGRKFIEERSRS